MTALNEPPRTLLLWDIDHTLIETRGVGRAVYDRVFLAVTGKKIAELTPISGRTQLDIMRESLRLSGIEPTEAVVSNLAAALTKGYEDAREELATTGRALPGARETLAALAGEPALHQAVLSGNLKPVSRIKLEVFGLADYLDLDSSAYGDDHVSRAELVKIAQGRARERIGSRFDNADTVLIGDTPNDVQTALTAGVRVVAVATGKSSEDELRAAGAAVVLPGLERAAEVLRGLG